MSSIENVTGRGPLLSAFRHELHHLRSHWWWFTVLGGVLVASGTAAIVFPHLTVLTTFAITTFLSVLMIVCGVATIVGAFWAGKWSGLLLQLLVGIMYLVTGVVMTENAVFTVVLLTALVATLFIVMGVFRIVAALMFHFPQWGWVLLNGVITMLAGIIIFRQLPSDALWVIGLLVGLEMLFNGWSWIMLSLALKALPEEKATA